MPRIVNDAAHFVQCNKNRGARSHLPLVAAPVRRGGADSRALVVEEMDEGRRQRERNIVARFGAGDARRASASRSPDASRAWMIVSDPRTSRRSTTICRPPVSDFAMFGPYAQRDRVRHRTNRPDDRARNMGAVLKRNAHHVTTALSIRPARRFICGAPRKRATNWLARAGIELHRRAGLFDDALVAARRSGRPWSLPRPDHA